MTTVTLTPKEAEAYLERVELPQVARDWLREGPHGPNALRAVTALQRQHLITVPFENLGQHYSESHSLPQDTEHTFDNVVTKKRGGICTQVHQLFVKLLRTFGFVAYNTGCRINAVASLLSDPNLDRTKISYGQW
jgi:arylamine N-acetyltransferase